MIGFVMLGTNDIEKSSKFYDIILATIEVVKVYSGEKSFGYAKKNNPKKIEFYITKPQNKEIATNGNGTMVALKVETKEKVDEFHFIALQNGALNEGLPGYRHDNNYYAYIRDMDSNKICVYCSS